MTAAPAAGQCNPAAGALLLFVAHTEYILLHSTQGYFNSKDLTISSTFEISFVYL